MFKKAALFLVLSIAATLASVAPAYASHRFVIFNNGSHTAYHIQISGVNRSLWGPDLLGRYVLRPGVRDTFNIGEGCAEDVRIIYTNGYTIVRGNINTCAYNLNLTY